MAFELHVLKALKDNFVYAFVHGDECAILDPGEAAPVERFLEERGLKLTRILLTHHHWDHVDGVPDLVAKWKCEVLASETDVGRIAGATRAASGEIEVFGEPARILTLPGHTQGQIAYYFWKRESLFVGDTLFSAGCGRLKEGTAAQLHESLKIIAALPASTRIYFGHEYTLRNLDFVLHYHGADETAVREYRVASERKLANGAPTTPTDLKTEMAVNPFLKSQSLEEFTKWRSLRDMW